MLDPMLLASLATKFSLDWNFLMTLFPCQSCPLTRTLEDVSYLTTLAALIPAPVTMMV